MAEAKEDESADMDILTCSICLEIFKTPRFLPCLHTFCEACLVTYVESSTVDRDNTKVFPCPVCRKNFQLENETKELLISQFPHNHLINSLLDRKAIRKSEKLCQVCELSDVTEVAVSFCVICQEALCTTCEDYHRKFKMTSRHKVILIQDMIKEHNLDCVYSGIYCEKHREEVVKLFCEDHTKPCCTICATVEHRKCNSVIELIEAAKKFKDSSSAKTLKDEVVKFEYNLREAKVLGEQNVELINKQYEELNNVIESTKSSVINHITLLAKTATEDAKTNKKALIKKEEDKIEEVTRLETTVKNWLRIIDSCSHQGTDIEFLIEGNRILDRKKNIGNRHRTI